MRVPRVVATPELARAIRTGLRIALLLATLALTLLAIVRVYGALLAP